MTRDAGVDALGLHARVRLDRLALEFDRLDSAGYSLFAARPPDPDRTAAAERTALRLMGNGPRKEAIRSAVTAFMDAVTTAYSRRMPLPQTFLLNQGLPDRPEDRVRVLATLERAVVALALWDELDPDDRDVLVGPWNPLIEGAL
jgi:hypothetical protein